MEQGEGDAHGGERRAAKGQDARDRAGLHPRMLRFRSHVAAPASAGSYQTFAYNPAGQIIDQAQGSSRYVWSGQPTTTTNVTHDALNRDAAIAAAAGYDATAT